MAGVPLQIDNLDNLEPLAPAPPVPRLPRRLHPGPVALIVKKRLSNKILDGDKTWELRGNQIRKRGRALIAEAGAKGLIVGEVRVRQCVLVGLRVRSRSRRGEVSYMYRAPALQPERLFTLPLNFGRHCLTEAEVSGIRYPTVYAWCMESPVRYPQPVRFNHVLGCTQWAPVGPEAVAEADVQYQAATGNQPWSRPAE